ncbi:MAG TPA: hypothetical protein VK489_11285 [Ferruginibacter sp.]|nr:hypothetical protein [Ferruginibacter sp.]
MTHSARFIAATMLLSVALFTDSYAQEVTAIAAIQPSYVNNTFHVKEGNSTKIDPAANPVVTAKFSGLFPTAASQKWTTDADNCWVSFSNNGRNVRASFTLKGELNYIITDCAMEHLPRAFSKAIAKQYASYQLFNAIEITAHGAVAYQAILEDSKGFVTLKYTPGGVEEIQQVKKQ